MSDHKAPAPNCFLPSPPFSTRGWCKARPSLLEGTKWGAITPHSEGPVSPLPRVPRKEHSFLAQQHCSSWGRSAPEATFIFFSQRCFLPECLSKAFPAVELTSLRLKSFVIITHQVCPTLSLLCPFSHV